MRRLRIYVAGASKEPDRVRAAMAAAGAEVTEPQRAACGDVHNEYEVCRVCDLGARAEAACGDCLDPMCTGEPCKHASTASAVSPEANRPVAEGPVEAVDAASLALDARGVQLWRADWRQLAEVARKAGGVDALICDPPYSERTHRGHDDGTAQANRVADWARSKIERGETRKRTGARVETFLRDTLDHGGHRREITYSAWTAEDVEAFVDTWAPLTRGWFVALTDHVLVPAYERALERHGFYVFSPLACVEPGSRFRATGDGHSQWSCQAVVARPQSGPWLTAWREKRRAAGEACSLDGAYIVGAGMGDARSGRRDGSRLPGGKPLSLMRALVRDHSFRGEVVCDPTAGGGTTGEACIAEGRRALLGDRDAAHVEIARKRLLSCPGEQRRLTLDVEAPAMVQAGFDLDDDSGA